MLTNPTTCLYLKLSHDMFRWVVSHDFAWPNQEDRNGDGEAEELAFLQATEENGIRVRCVSDTHTVNGLPDSIPADAVSVWENVDEHGYFALAIVPADGYWDRGEWRWVPVAV